MDPSLSSSLRRFATGLLLALIVLCVAWEAFLAPIYPGGSWLILKAVPLALPLRNISKGNVYTYQWTSMLVLLYFAEGVMRAWSDLNPVSAALAGGEILLSMLFFVTAVLYVRPAKQAARRARAAADSGSKA